jgi:uncharacterized repeat protein (TIGR01451 family)
MKNNKSKIISSLGMLLVVFLFSMSLSFPTISSAEAESEPVNDAIVGVVVSDTVSADANKVVDSPAVEENISSPSRSPIAPNTPIINTRPTITVNPDTLTLNVGDLFNPQTYGTEHVTVSDLETSLSYSNVEVIPGDFVDTSKEGTYKIIYKVTDSGPGEPLSACATLTVTINKPAEPTYVDLSITKIASVSSVKTNTDFTYTITAKNLSANKATDVKVNDVLDSDLQSVASSTTKGLYLSDVWNIGDLEPNEEVYLSLTVKSPVEKTVLNSASIVSKENDSNATDNTSTVIVTVNNGSNPVSIVDLSITKTASVSSVKTNTDFTYTITAINASTTDATNVKVSDILNSNLELVASTTSQGLYSGSEWNIGNLASNTSATLTLTVKAKTEGTVRNTANILSNETDFNPLDNEIFVDVVVDNGSNPNPVASVTLAANPGTINKGESSVLSWTSENTTSCTANWTSQTTTSGSETLSPGSTTEYSITCTGSYDPVSAKATVTVNTGGNGGGGGGGGMGGHRHPVVVQGEILGATSCFYLRDFLKKDWQNDWVEVLKLQSFLNVYEGESLSLTAVYDDATFAAVERFQTKYNTDILQPWGDKVTTGFVYILTKKKVNEIYCSSEFPITSLEQQEVNDFKNIPNASGSFGSGSLENDSLGVKTEGQENETLTKDTNNASSTTVVLEDNSTPKESILRNAAVSLFAFPNKMFGNWKYMLMFLLLIVILIVAVKIIFGSKNQLESGMSLKKKEAGNSIKDNNSEEEFMSYNDEDKSDELEVFPDEEMVIEEPDEILDEEVK